MARERLGSVRVRVVERRVTRSGAFFVTGTFGEYLASSREGAKDLVERRDASVEAVAAGEEEDENDSSEDGVLERVRQPRMKMKRPVAVPERRERRGVR